MLGLVIYELLKFELHSFLKEKQNKNLEFIVQVQDTS